MGSRLGRSNKIIRPKMMATVQPTMLDIAWAAGVYEGEGCIHGGVSRPSVAITIPQKDRWMLDRLKDLFGGSVYLRSTKSACHQWFISGPRARGFAYTIFSFLSPRRRRQVRAALGKEG